MYRKIASSIKYPALWAGTAESPSRWRQLDQLDRLLDGTFYDHLRYSFYDESLPGQEDREIPLLERRPSSPFHLPRMVARWSGRKLWAGRHVPRIRHSDDSVTRVIDQLMETTQFYLSMMEATILGSVGSVAMTFGVSREQDEPQVGIRVWRAKYCIPAFDDYRNLVSLRVNYNVHGSSILGMGIETAMDGNKIQRDQEYWWVRDFLPDREITYIPTPADDYNPVMGWHKYAPLPRLNIEHGLGFVPGVWIRNLSGSITVDGVGTWTDAKDISIELDYLLSQAARGTRYNCAPELVIVGELAGGTGEIGARSPSNYIHLKAAAAQEGGEKFGGGEASLLEMTGEGIRAAHDLIDKLRNMALEQIGGTRKDPEKMKGVMSGAAMQYMDEDAHDLVMELRSSYGVAALELVRKIVRALGIAGDPKGCKIEWPRLYHPTAEDLAHLIPGLVLAVTPVQEPLDPVEAAAASASVGGGKSSTQKGEGTAGGRPSVKPTGGKSIGSLLTMEEGSQYLRLFMDIDLLPDADSSGVSDSDVPTSSTSEPEERTEGVDDTSRQSSEPNPMDGGMSE